MGREHWVETTLGNVVLHKKGKKPKKLERSEFPDSLPYVDIEAFETGNIKQYADVKSSNCCNIDDVLVVWDGARFGLTGYNQRGSVGSTLACLTPIAIETTYLLNFIQRHYKTIQSNPKGTGIPHVNPGIFWNLEIPLPPLNEQKRIVEKLDAILPKVKSAKARLEKFSAILKKFRQSILSAACSGRLTEDWREGKDLPVVIVPDSTAEHDLDIPDSWVVCRAKDVCKNVESGSTPKGKPFTATGEIPYLKVYNIVNQNINFDYKPQFIPKAVHEKELKRCKCYPNDVLMNIVGPPLGKIALVTDQFPEWNINQAIVVYRSQNFLNHLFLYHWLCSLEPIRETLKETRGSAGQINISLTQARNIFIPIPPFEEQQEIVRRVEKLFALADSLEGKYKTAKERVEKIEQSVLAKAFRGELAEPDPNDEPAAELLKRILEEKAKLESSKKTKIKRSAKTAVVVA